MEELDQHQRTRRCIGDAVDKLAECHVAVFGIGGVGGFVVEGLARAGVGELTLVDKDCVDVTNINRQIVALHSTVGRPKVKVAEERVHDINPAAVVHTHECFYLPETMDEFDFSQYDYVVDAMDTVTAKISLVDQAKKASVPVICAMGAGNKLDPTLFRVADIEDTSVCPLAKVMRRELRRRGIRDVKVVFSTEAPHAPIKSKEELAAEAAAEKRVKQSPGSISFVPSVVGLIIAGQVIRDLAEIE